MKKTALILSIISLLSLCSCIDNPTSSDLTSNDSNNIITFDPNNIGKENSNIVSIEVLNVPSTPIEIGHFSEANIKLKVTYTNEEEETYLIDEDFFSKESLSIISTVGKKHVTIVFNQNRVSFDIEMIKAKDVVSYSVTFLDFYGNTVYVANVGYLQTARYVGSNLDNIIDGDYFYKFSGEWDKSLENIHKNISVQAIYERKHVMYNHNSSEIGDSLPYIGKYNIVSPDASSEKYRYIFYMGRYYSYPFSYSSSYYHDSQVGKTINFSYNEIIDGGISSFYRNKLRDGIYNAYQYQKEYIFDDEAKLDGEDLFIFNESSFDGITYDDTTSNDIENSANPAFITRFYDSSFHGYYLSDGSISYTTSLADTYYSICNKYSSQTIKDYVYPSDINGYYRLALTANVDCYLILDASKTNYHQYEIDEVKFGFFPDADTTSIVKEYSVNSSFDDEYINPLKLDSNIIYNSLKNAFSN